MLPLLTIITIIDEYLNTGKHILKKHINVNLSILIKDKDRHFLMLIFFNL